jgi:hypothetical protein
LFEEGRTFERGRVGEKDTWKREGECVFSVRALKEEEDLGKNTKEDFGIKKTKEEDFW